jgi:hypothetical protein
MSIPLEALQSAAPGLPDGLFLNRKSQFGITWEGLRLENVDILKAH